MLIDWRICGLVVNLRRFRIGWLTYVSYGFDGGGDDGGDDVSVSVGNGELERVFPCLRGGESLVSGVEGFEEEVGTLK
jgi:hypothetical protein